MNLPLQPSTKNGIRPAHNPTTHHVTAHSHVPVPVLQLTTELVIYLQLTQYSLIGSVWLIYLLGLASSFFFSGAVFA